MKPNIVLLTMGRSGSTVFTQMLGRAGWNLPVDADEFAEPLAVRDINERILHRLPVADEEFHAALSMHEPPVVLKDPRFCWTLKHWKPFLKEFFLIWYTREIADVEASLRNAKWGKDTERGYTLRGATLPTIKNWCKTYYDNWEGPKLHLSHEQIREAVSLFDVER